MYRPFGMADNMVLIFYGLSFLLVLKVIFSQKDSSKWLWGFTILPFFLIGEETRWGLIYFSDHLKTLPFTGIQDVLQMALFPWFQARTEEQAFIVLVARLVLALAFIGGAVFLWHERHDLKKWKREFIGLWFLPYLALWFLFLCGALYIEIFTFSERNTLNIIEENLELNAAFAWLVMASQIKNSRQS